MNLILGASGYVGEALTEVLVGKGETVLAQVCSGPTAALDRCGTAMIQEDLLDPVGVLQDLSPERVFLLARPVAEEDYVFHKFGKQVKQLIEGWTRSGTLRSVVFASTQLVYRTSTSAEPIAHIHPLGPECAYDRHKVEMENWLKQLTTAGRLEATSVYRLPLVSGRACSKRHARVQQLPQWLNGYRDGARWEFPSNPADRTWGNSWVHAADLAWHMADSARLRSGYRIEQPVSGHFTYWELDQWFRDRLKPLPPLRRPLHLPKTTFFLRNESAIPARNLSEALDPLLPTSYLS